MTIDIRPEDLRVVLSILDRHLPGREVRAFGSRVGGKANPFSDLDPFRRIIEREFMIVRGEGVTA